MDGARFDRLTRSLSSRRTALGGVLGGSLAVLLGLASPEETDAHNYLARCRRLQSVPRRRACLRRARVHNRSHQSPPPAPCAGKPNDSACNGDGKCLNGVCNPPPDCLTYTADCSSGDTPCCGGSESQCVNPFGDFYECINRGKIGELCQRNGDCLSESCVGYRCGYRICPAGQDACRAPATCGRSGGQCFQPDGGGPTRCGTVAPASCGYASHQQCADAFADAYGQGAFLVRFTPNARCTCGPASPLTTFCAIPA